MSQMYDHALNIVKGWPDMSAIDWNAPVEDQNTIVAGRVITLNADGEFQLGIANEDDLIYFALNGSTSFDAIGDQIADSASVGFTGVPVSTTEIKPNVTGLCITNGYHAQTTEWTGVAATFVPNVPLKTSATGQLEVNDNTAVHATVGYVHRGVITNQYGVSVLDFVMNWEPVH